MVRLPVSSPFKDSVGQARVAQVTWQQQKKQEWQKQSHVTAGLAANHFQLSLEDPVDKHGAVLAAGYECVAHHSPPSRDVADLSNVETFQAPQVVLWVLGDLPGGPPGGPGSPLGAGRPSRWSSRWSR